MHAKRSSVRNRGLFEPELSISSELEFARGQGSMRRSEAVFVRQRDLHHTSNCDLARSVQPDRARLCCVSRTKSASSSARKGSMTERDTAWIRFMDAESRALSKPILETFHGSAMALTCCEAEVPTGSGVVVFDKLTPELLAFIQGESMQGERSLIALACRASELTSDRAWQLLEAGASDAFGWDHSSAPALEVRDKIRRWLEIDAILASDLVRHNLVGASPVWKRSLRSLAEIAVFSSVSLLITGESGTGKELAANLIHTLDRRSDKKNLIVLDCTTVVPELSGSEFFGHERGAFTGANVAREGAFALAHGGTLFLDEVGELPLRMQAELLRAIQEREYKRVGSNDWLKSDFRLICATHRNLVREEAEGRFRRDFYFRITSAVCELPSLDQRREDILPLARHFMRQLNPKAEANFDEPVARYLVARPYPGNVRELRQLVARMLSKHVGSGPLTAGDLPVEERALLGRELGLWCDGHFEHSISRALSMGARLKEIGKTAEDVAVRLAVRSAGGNLQDAAQRLGVTDRALQLRKAQRAQPDVPQ